MSTGNPEPVTNPSSTAGSFESSNELVRLLLDSTAEGIYGIDLKGECTFANPACWKILGYDSDADLLGKNMHVLIHHTRSNGDPYPEKECRIFQALRQLEGTHVEDEVLWCSNGESFAAEYWSYPVFRGEERVGCVVTFIDITERRKVEEELRQAHEQVRLLLDSTAEGIYGIDLKGNCTFANPACWKLLGFESDAELLGQNMHNLIHHTRSNGDPYPENECRIYQALRQSEGTHVEDEVLWRADGASFPAEYWSYPAVRDGERVGCVVTFVDITERRRVEEELRQTEKMAALGKLSAGLAHELNNPAAAAVRAAGQLMDGLDEMQATGAALIQTGVGTDLWDSLNKSYREFRQRSGGALTLSPLEASDREEELLTWLDQHGVDDGWELAPTLVAADIRIEDLDNLVSHLSECPLKEAMAWLCKALETRELAATVVRSSRTISELVAAVKSYSHMDQAAVQDVDIHVGLEDTLKILHHKLKQGVDVLRRYDRTLPRVTVRGSELNQVWTNLIDNSIDALDSQGTITITTSKEDSYLTVDIEDDGPGIPAEVQSRIFDPFFTTKGVGQGSGLGLDVVRRIVEDRCGGKVALRSKPGETVVSVRIPVQLCEVSSSEAVRGSS